jgi:hypothetical protein
MLDILRVAQSSAETASSFSLSIPCPVCGHRGTFQHISGPDIRISTENNIGTSIGFRKCPNDSCRALLMFAQRGGNIIQTYPAARIDFDRTEISETVLQPFEEAVTCHANQCYIASAIMVRKTLEMLCHDKQVTGSNLKERIAALRTSVVLPQELLTGMDDLRLLGNDAAHIESQVFVNIGKEEIEIAIEFTKEVLKAVYQYAALLAKLKSLKKP